MSSMPIEVHCAWRNPSSTGCSLARNWKTISWVIEYAAT